MLLRCFCFAEVSKLEVVEGDPLVRCCSLDADCQATVAVVEECDRFDSVETYPKRCAGISQAVL